MIIKIGGLSMAILEKSIDVIKVNSEFLTPEQFLKLTPRDKSNIDHSSIVPARLGKESFGQIEVFYKSPIFKGSK